jgi:hypothetical protein
MDAVAMSRRCLRSKALGPARLARHRLAVMREGWLTAVRDPSAVHGALWDLALSDIPALGRHEALPQGLYVKRTQPVIAERGPKRALVYFGANAGPGALRPAYIAEVLAAPSAGLAALGRWRSGSAAFRVERPPRTSLRARMISKTYLLFRAAL